MLAFPLAMLSLMMLLTFPCSSRANPDFTAGGTRLNNRTVNLGPTGMRGWVFHVNSGDRVADTSTSRQILVMSAASGSPADGLMQADDVILGASGTGAEPELFDADARKSLAYAIADAEAHDPAILKLLRWRDGETTTVSLTLRHFGAYSPTAPYNCPKSAQILAEGLQAILDSNEGAGRDSFGILSLLAGNNPDDPGNAARMSVAQSRARALVPNAATRAQMMSDERDGTANAAWQRGSRLIVLAEYYLLTGDEEVLPGIEAFAVNIAKNTSLFGTTGHIFADKNLDGSPNGPMGGVYGTINTPGLQTFLGLLLARECGIDHPTIDPAIERASTFFASYAGKGAIPYGEHVPSGSSHESNGKSGLTALALALLDNRQSEARFFAKMATAGASEREVGHTGAFFNFLWAPIGAAQGGELAAAAHFKEIAWHLDLSRRWDGVFDYDCLNSYGPLTGYHSGNPYYGYRMSTAALLAYALPLRQLHITGRDQDETRDLTAEEVSAARAADGYQALERSNAELIEDLANWSVMVRLRAGEELATRELDSATLAHITALANDSEGDARIGACIVLGKYEDEATADARAATLAALLTDPDAHVSFMAAEAMRYLPRSAQLSQLETILAAAVSTAEPVLPLREGDPLHLTNGRIGMLLFYHGTAYGPRGVIWDDLTGVDREALYPAIRAIAKTPTGLARSGLQRTYQNLTLEDVEALADTIVDSIAVRAPADKMFSDGIRLGGIQVLEKHDIAEGVPLSMIFMIDDIRVASYKAGLAVLEDYAASSLHVRPDPEVPAFLRDQFMTNREAEARAVLAAIAADTDPRPLRAFKTIDSITADDPSMNLPQVETMLRASATDLAQGEGRVFTWRKVHGAGEVTFTPNGTDVSDNTLVEFDGVPGTYGFEVVMSDARGLTEAYDSVVVTLRDADGNLPENLPPIAEAQTVSASPGVENPITLTGIDPEGFPLIFSVLTLPEYGRLTGTAPDLSYSYPPDYVGPDSFTFQVMDSEGQVDSATVEIVVDTGAAGLVVYEPFDYEGVNSSIEGRDGGIGLRTDETGRWRTSGQGQNIDFETGRTSFSYGNGTTINAVGGLDFENLPTAGSGLTRLPSNVGWRARRIMTDEIRFESSLFDDNNTMWFSLLISPPRDNALGTFIIGGAAFRTNDNEDNGKKDFAGRTALGVTLRNESDGVISSGDGSIKALMFLQGSIDGTISQGGYRPPLQTGATHRDTTLVVGKVNFRPEGEEDELFLFRVEDTLDDEPDESTAFATLKADYDQSNSSSITIWDRGSTIFDEIRIGTSYRAVVPRTTIPPPPTPFGVWAAANELTGPEADPYASAAGDGVSNLVRYFLGMDPRAYAPGGVKYDSNGLIDPGLPRIDFREDAFGFIEPIAVFPRRKDRETANLQYLVRFSADLETWWISYEEPELMAEGGVDHEVDLVCVPFPLFIETEEGMIQPIFFQLLVQHDWMNP